MNSEENFLNKEKVAHKRVMLARPTIISGLVNISPVPDIADRRASNTCPKGFRSVINRSDCGITSAGYSTGEISIPIVIKSGRMYLISLINTPIVAIR